ncbi:MAG: hypothetical protein ABW042_08435 [Phenylobacterium sp.]
MDTTSEYAIEDEALYEEPENELVQWMAPKPLSLGATGIAGVASAAFVLGALTAVGVVAGLGLLNRRD